MNAKTLRGFVLAHYENGQDNDQACFSFELVGRTLTAHYAGGLNGAWAMQHPLTKRELELLLEGYPPLYRASYTLPGGVQVDSPIRNEFDIHSGAWIVHCGLSYAFDSPANRLAAYSMMTHDVPQYHTMNIYAGKRSNGLWRASQMKNAVERFGIVLETIEAAFPRNDMIKAVVELYKDWVHPDCEFVYCTQSMGFYTTRDDERKHLHLTGNSMFGSGH
jgi:hypothetical protein